jgi:hypothetical protein
MDLQNRYPDDTPNNGYVDTTDFFPPNFSFASHFLVAKLLHTNRWTHSVLCASSKERSDSDDTCGVTRRLRHAGGGRG